MYRKLELYTGNPEKDRTPKIIIVAPYVTNYFLNRDIIKAAVEEGIVEVHYQQIMPSLGEILGEEGWELLEERGFELDLPEQAIPRGMFDPHDNLVVKAPTLTGFDHRIADAHSFVEPVASRLKTRAEIPYKNKDTSYYEQEEIEYALYQKRQGVI